MIVTALSELLIDMNYIFVFCIFVTLINFNCFSRVKIRIMRFFSKIRERVDAFLHDEILDLPEA